MISCLFQPKYLHKKFKNRVKAESLLRKNSGTLKNYRSLSKHSSTHYLKYSSTNYLKDKFFHYLTLNLISSLFNLKFFTLSWSRTTNICVDTEERAPRLNKTTRDVHATHLHSLPLETTIIKAKAHMWVASWWLLLRLSSSISTNKTSHCLGTCLTT